MLFTEEEKKTLPNVEFDFKLAGGVSTLETGFMVGFPVEEDGSHPIACLLANPKGEIFARFDKDKTIRTSNTLSRAEMEAIQGVRALILNWLGDRSKC